MLLSMIRLEPLLACLTGRQAIAEQMLERLAEGESSAGVVAEFADFLPSLDVLQPASGLAAPDLRMMIDLKRLLKESVSDAIAGARTNSVDLLTATTERVFDLLLVLDKQGGKQQSDGLAGLEDAYWFEDCRDLDATEIRVAALVNRSRMAVRRLTQYCERHMSN